MTRGTHDDATFRRFLAVIHSLVTPGDLIGVGPRVFIQAFHLSYMLGRYELRGEQDLYVTNSSILVDAGPHSHDRENAALTSCLVLDIDDPVAHETRTTPSSIDHVRELNGRAGERVEDELGALPALQCFSGGGGLLVYPLSRPVNPEEYDLLISGLPFLPEISDAGVLRPGNLIRAIGSFHASRGVLSTILEDVEGVPINVDALLDGVGVPPWIPRPPCSRTPRRPRGGGDLERGRLLIKSGLENRSDR